MDAGLRNRYDALLKDLQSAIKRTEREMAESKFKIDDPRLEKYKEHIRQLKKFRGSLNAIESAHKDARAKGQFFNASTTALAFNRIAMIEAAIGVSPDPPPRIMGDPGGGPPPGFTAPPRRPAGAPPPGFTAPPRRPGGAPASALAPPPPPGEYDFAAAEPPAPAGPAPAPAFAPAVASAKEDEFENCSICRDPMLPGQDIHTGSCGHSVHNECYRPLVRSVPVGKKPCPLCRKAGFGKYRLTR